MITSDFYSQKHIGCWADGAFGHEHIRECLSARVQDCIAFGIRENCEASRAVAAAGQAIYDALQAPMSDDASEEDEAIEWLDQFCHGVVFGMCDGDLVCVASDPVGGA